MDYHGIAESLNRFAQQFQPLVEAAEAFDKIGSLEQGIADATKRREQALKEHAQASAALLSLNAEIEKSKGVAGQVISAAETQASQLRKSAAEEAAELVAKAHVETASLRSKADSEIKSRLAEAQEELDDILAKIALAKDEHGKRQGLIEQASQEHAELHEKIAKAKAAVSRMLS